ncbi:hypothetical protein EC988_001384 [Linderina pennispora]|nr:hypothetical protein EC988_001384 [Linderina pennispora]
MRYEIEAYEKLGSGHPNICKYHGCQVEDNLVTGIVLDEYSEPLEDAVVDSPQRLVEQLEDAVRYIHSVGVVHGDINPKNIMVHDGDLFLIDFDSCGADNPKSGSKGYMSPNYAKTEADDWYAVGKVKEFVMKSARSNDEPRGDRPQQGTAESAA